jgi:heat shock protein HslJ
MHRSTSPITLAGTLLVLAACQARNDSSGAPPEQPGVPASPAPGLAGSWRLVVFESSDDQIGTVRPADPTRYTMTLEPDGRIAMQLDCNRGMGSWSATPSGDESGSFEIRQLATTKAACPPPSLGEQLARHAEYVRTYVLRGGRLYLNLMADGGNYVWEPLNR